MKSWINHPLGAGAPLRAGMVQLNGVAFSGSGPVTRVDVSVDGGNTWKKATFFGPHLGFHAWRLLPALLVLVAGAMPFPSYGDGSPKAVLEFGWTVFTQTAQPSCTICHTLNAAGAAGTIGPSLDDLKPDREHAVA